MRVACRLVISFRMGVAVAVVLLSTSCAAGERVLVPPGGVVVGRGDRNEHCYQHNVLTIRTTQAAAEAWATDLGLLCDVDGGVPCLHWSKGATGENFWRESRGILDGYDSLDARMEGELLRVDHGDYTCHEQVPR
jgi:hypothetical protein